MAYIIVSLCMVLLFTKELTGIKCFACTQGGNCKKDIKEKECPKDPWMDKCLLMIDNKNEQIARDCANEKLCGIADKNCKEAKEARTGDCDVTCCATDLCNAGSNGSPLLWLSVLCFITYEVLTGLLPS
ncbi:uncharacterized protein LOC144641630 [Oculina patagonica]